MRAPRGRFAGRIQRGKGRLPGGYSSGDIGRPMTAPTINTSARPSSPTDGPAFFDFGAIPQQSQQSFTGRPLPSQPTTPLMTASEIGQATQAVQAAALMDEISDQAVQMTLVDRFKNYGKDFTAGLLNPMNLGMMAIGYLPWMLQSMGQSSQDYQETPTYGAYAGSPMGPMEMHSPIYDAGSLSMSDAEYLAMIQQAMR